MKISRLAFAAADLPLAKPMHTARGTITSRQILVTMLHGEGLTGIGEAAPFPEHGTESFDDAFQIISALAVRKKFPPLTLRLDRAGGWLKAIGVSREFAPATAWSLECAIASLIAQKKRAALPALLAKSYPRSVPVNALVSGRTSGEILGAAEKAIASGYRTIKIKLGLRSVASELETIRKLRQICGDTTEIRADANEAWSLEQAIAFCQGARHYGLEYVEDPLRDPTPETLRVLRSVSPVALALDQFANKPGGFEQILTYKLCRVIVLKPAVIGSFSRLRCMAREARKHKISVVISTLIESGIGLSFAAVCAAVFGSRSLAHGVGTAEMLRDHSLYSHMKPENGRISLSRAPFFISPDVIRELTERKAP